MSVPLFDQALLASALKEDICPGGNYLRLT